MTKYLYVWIFAEKYHLSIYLYYLRTLGNTSFGTTIKLEHSTPQSGQTINIFESQPDFEDCYVEESVIEQSQELQLPQLKLQQQQPTVVHQSPSTSLAEFQPEEKPSVTASRSLKRKKDEERLDTLCGAVSDWIKKSEPAPQPVSRNSDFLNVLDSYLLKYEEDVQDKMKIEILNFVFNGGQFVVM